MVCARTRVHVQELDFNPELSTDTEFNTAVYWPPDEATPEQLERKSNLKVALQECWPQKLLIDIMTVCRFLIKVLF